MKMIGFLRSVKVLLAFAMLFCVGAVFVGAATVEQTGIGIGEAVDAVLSPAIGAVVCFALIVFCDRIAGSVKSSCRRRRRVHLPINKCGEPKFTRVA